MAKFRVLSDKDIKNGTYPLTPKEKARRYKTASIVLSIIILLQQVALVYFAMRK